MVRDMEEYSNNAKTPREQAAYLIATKLRNEWITRWRKSSTLLTTKEVRLKNTKIKGSIGIGYYGTNPFAAFKIKSNSTRIEIVQYEGWIDIERFPTNPEKINIKDIIDTIDLFAEECKREYSSRDQSWKEALKCLNR